jgi:hypothetical protein
MNTRPVKLTEHERTTIVNALTVAARQYEIDAERASELALHGMTTFEPARDLGKQFQELAADARQLQDKITFLWENIQL